MAGAGAGRGGRPDDANGLFASIEELERRFRAASGTKDALFDPAVDALRRDLTRKIEQVMLLDYPSAAGKDVESRLWKNVIYKTIDDYRRQSKLVALLAMPFLARDSHPRHMQLTAVAAKVSEQGSLAVDAPRRLRVLNGQFRAFLTDTGGFYFRLIQKLCAVHALDATESVFADTFRTELVPLSDAEKRQLPKPTGAAGEPEAVGHAVCRLLIYLGDLARYRTLYSGLHKPNYAAAEEFYRLAAVLAPDWGNPFNQMAVIANYRSDDFGALHFYLRSLVVPRAFLTSRGNLDVLLRKLQRREVAATSPFAPCEPASEKAWKDEFGRSIAAIFAPERK
ncbi:hypothetical protein DFJ74DRAFT_643891 [Hyaloraphidium curvatum]|nr:hypothetical protein DFJ74DRAFT_643891 [Hyaloraphidium curvatum]